MTTIAVVSTLGGVGKTSLVYHLSWMYAEIGLNVLAVDVDPQANLTRLFVSSSRLEQLWGAQGDGSISDVIRPLLDGKSEIRTPHVEHVADNISLLPGHLELSLAESEFGVHWAHAAQPDAKTILAISALARTVRAAAKQSQADVTLMDLSPNLGALNRTALAAADYIVVPVLTSLTSSLGLRVLGPALRRWRDEWKALCARNVVPGLALPIGRMCPAGYVVRKDPVGLEHFTGGMEELLRQTASAFHGWVLGEEGEEAVHSPEDDPSLLGLVKPYRSLMAMSYERRKPMFLLTPADGALGGHAQAVRDAYMEYFVVAANLARLCGLALPR